jgi:phenylacetate-CoA ligase
MSGIAKLLYDYSPVMLQTVLLNGYAVKLHLRQFRGGFSRELNQLLESQWWLPEQLEHYQNERLKALIKHAYHTVPYYQDVMKDRHLTPEDIRTVADLCKLPILTRETIQKNSHRLISERFGKLRLIHGHTSGTTGSPWQFYWDRNTCIFNNAVDWRQKEWAGMKFGEPYAVLLGRMIVPPKVKKPPFWRMNYLHNQLWLSSFHMNDENLPHYIAKLEGFKPVALEGYPSTIYILARYLDHLRKTFPLRAVLTSSEPLLSSQRELMERVFDCKVFDFYGRAERVIFATECEKHQGHHLNSEYGIAEILDKDNLPCPTGKFGRLIGTSLHNFAMPFIRYLTRDVTAIREECCSCGRALPLIDDIVTKDEDIVITPDGRLISPSVLTHVFKPLDGILESQIIQEDVCTIRVRVVRSEGYREEYTSKLVDGLSERLGSQVKIEVEFVEAIERTASGKFRWVISKVPLPF